MSLDEFSLNAITDLFDKDRTGFPIEAIREYIDERFSLIPSRILYRLYSTRF